MVHINKDYNIKKGLKPLVLLGIWQFFGVLTVIDINFDENLRSQMIKMKKLLSRYFLVVCLGMGLSTMSTGCKTGEGCNTSQYTAKTDKNGNMSTKRGKSNLFAKKNRKKR